MVACGVATDFRLARDRGPGYRPGLTDNEDPTIIDDTDSEGVHVKEEGAAAAAAPRAPVAHAPFIPPRRSTGARAPTPRAPGARRELPPRAPGAR
eukprot:gene8201-18279_t